MKCVECNKELKAIQTSHFRGSCSSNLKSLAEYKLKHPTAPIRCAETRKKLAHSLQSFVSRYGEIEGEARWDAYRKKLSDKNSLEFFLKKGKTVNDWEEYNSSRAVTLENLIAKYGEMEGSQRFKSYCDKQRKAGNTLEYFAEKYGIEEGSEKYSNVCKSKGITLENMIRVHGREKGFIQYDKWLEKTKGNYVSLIACQFIKDIVEILPSNYIFHGGVFSKEFWIWDGTSVKMFDFVITSPVKRL